MSVVMKLTDNYLVMVPDTSSETGSAFNVEVDTEWGSMKVEPQIPGIWRTKEETIFVLRNLADAIEKHL